MHNGLISVIHKELLNRKRTAKTWTQFLNKHLTKGKANSSAESQSKKDLKESGDSSKQAMKGMRTVHDLEAHRRIAQQHWEPS